MHSKRSVLVIALLLAALGTAKAVEISQAEWDAVKKDISDLRKQRSADTPTARSTTVDKALEAKGYGPDAPVKTRDGKLKIGGMLQIWYYSFQNDHRALFDDPTINSVSDSNTGSDISSFRIRRAELKFTMDIQENVTAYVKIDPAKEAGNFPVITDNQINTGYIFKTINNVGANYQSIVGGTKPFGFGSSSLLTKVDTGTSATFQPQLLEIAYINYHGVVPHHDFEVGQFVPWTGEEGSRDASQLDFIERSFGGILDNRYALGAFVHGTWWDDRFQYWASVMDDPGDFFGSLTTNTANRTDTNDNKDLGFRLQVRPVYKNETWGNLELGGGTLFGVHGESNNLTPVGNPGTPDNGLVEVKTGASNNFAWLWYRPGAVASGLWLRGEWKLVHDRMAPGTVIDPYGDGSNSKSIYVQQLGKPIAVDGFYAAIGYKLSESCFCDSCPGWLKPFEFAGRYQVFQNVLLADPDNPTHTDLYKTQVVTGGINYYIKGQNAKVQLNYNWVMNPRVDNNPGLSFHNTKDDSIALNFQVAF